MSCLCPKYALYMWNDGKKELTWLHEEEYLYYKSIGKKNLIMVPCGQCIGCRIDYSKEWANRCCIESIYHDQGCFLTLTYDDQHVPRVMDQNEEYEHLSLRKEDFRLFMKRLRKALDPIKIRFFAAGEYGGKTLRPHYHCIVFGWKPDFEDCRKYKKNNNGDQLYCDCKFLDDIWQKGYVVIGDLSWKSCAYTARYILKKQTGKTSSIYYALGIEPEFSLMSRKPGIGRRLYDERGDELFSYDKINLNVHGEPLEFSKLSYFDRLLKVDNEELYHAVKDRRRRRAEEQFEAQLCKTDKDEAEYRVTKGESLLNKIKSLRRDEV